MAIGHRLLPALVDEIAQSDPSRIFYSVPKSKDLSHGFRDIDARTFARAVNRCSWYLEEKLGRGHGFPTLAYMGPQDVVYAILILACVKTGYKLLLTSPRNTIEAHVSLLEKTECATFLLPPNYPLPAVKQILAARQMHVLEIPTMEHWLEDGPVETYAYTKTFTEARLEPFVVLHTSGSTGMPKPIVENHGTVSIVDAFTALPSLGEKPTYPAMCAGKRVYLTFPLFHCAGMSMILPACIYNGFTVVLGPFPPSAEVANAVHVYGNVQYTCLAPTTLVDLTKDPAHLNNLGRLENVAYGGGPLPQAVGDQIISKTRLVSCLGSTECGIFPICLCDLEDWAYMSFSPVAGLEYRPVSENQYEQVVVRRPELEQYQGIFATFPELTEWPMKDLYSKHPTKANVWIFRGRTDDIIVFSTGEKLNPLEMQCVICANPAVNAALVTGLGRFQASLLVEAAEPPRNEDEKEKLLNAIWPSVEAANKISPSHGRIHRDMIAFTTEDKPMLRAGKGTVQRTMTIDLYSSELDALYKVNEAPSTKPASVGSKGDTSDVVNRIIAASTDIEISSLDPTADLFGQGLDSLQVALITKRINEYLSEQGKPQSMEARMLYSNPSIATITAVVSSLIGDQSLTESVDAAQNMLNLYEHHASSLPISARPAQPKSSGDFVVLLTGSTGSLGSYILDVLISDSQVSRIYCLNRGPGSLERQQKSQASKCLQPPLRNKVECLDADTSKPYFGLPVSKYKALLNEVSNVIHNAWQVDFNMAISSFSPQITAVSRFVDFSAHSKFGARLFFISSISTVMNWRSVAGCSDGVPEQIFEDWKVPEAIGYGQSKFVAERLLDTAAREAGVPAVVCRVGQIAGPTTAAGMWPKQEWLPSLIKSSKHLGRLPASLGSVDTVDWIPVDILARSVVELATSSTPEEAGATVYHAVNPQRTSWKELLPVFAHCLQTDKEIQIVPFAEWAHALRESASTTEDINENPAIKLLDFFAGVASKAEGEATILETRKTVCVSSSLAGLEAVQEEWVENWMKQWAF
ncbi:hypothetical protein BDV95DRAFT_561998 [Massariosphaeria phaeospora]|uniref:Carrier domain-containing protein n=1 Tax=Massariosphaeria phaeospora TaxID=100035 RepID=A0A7C8IJ06_9PLEO|nr:hypothetical protein BDV95DRAFT_561998 [Massariosphaeria phaeospora]